MGNISNEDLGRTLEDIAATGHNDPEQYRPAQLRKRPTLWDMVKDDTTKFGPQEDFYTEGNVFYAVSEAAKAWSYSKLPEGLHRVASKKGGLAGFDLERHDYLKFIAHRARQDQLMSRQDYDEAMEELHQIQRQWP